MDKSAKAIIIINLILVTICIGLIIFLVNWDSDSNYQSQKPINKVTYDSTSGASKNANTVFQEDSSYTIQPDCTYYLDKGNLKLFCNIVQVDASTLRISGKEYHMDKEMADARIEDSFTCDASDNQVFYNTTKSIKVKYDGLTASFTDHRNVALPYNGDLSLIQSIQTEDSLTNSGTINVFNIVSVNYAVQAPIREFSNDDSLPTLSDSISLTRVGDLVTDEYYSGSKSNADITPGSSLQSYLTSENERKTFTITAKFIESDSCSGTKYQDIKTGTYLYAFGQSYPYDSTTCNVVTMDCVYRGNESHFNGLYMDQSYPCFVINSIRKVTEDEIN